MIKIHQKKCQYLSETRSGRPEAQEGCHDDLVMALAIAYYIRPQQDMIVKQKTNEELQINIMKEFGFQENKSESDYGSNIVVF